MSPEAGATLERLRSHLLRSASVAQVGGFRPPDDPLHSWFGRGVGEPGEGLPLWRGQAMFPLLQIRIDELPHCPPPLQGLALLVLFLNHDEYPFDLPHGEGWAIREYRSLDGLVPLPASPRPLPLRPFPVRWHAVDDDAPGWEDAWSLLDLGAVNQDEAASDAFFLDFRRYDQTKAGGYPREVQHGHADISAERFAFQVGSEEKAQWMWADNGIGFFYRSPEGQWSWECQFY